MTRAEQAALEYLAEPTDPYSSPDELRTVMRLWDASAEAADAALTRFLALGWVDVVPASGPDEVPLVSLTDAGLAALAALPTAS